MHAVRVIDPFFGQYFAVEGAKSDMYWHPRFIIGPMHVRSYVDEKLANVGKRHRNRPVRSDKTESEKSCQHTYTGGTIGLNWTEYGSIGYIYDPYFAVGAHPIDTGLIEFEYEGDPGGDPPDPYQLRRFQSWWTEGETSAVVTVYYLHKAEELPAESWEFELRFFRMEDPNTGDIYYTFFKMYIHFGWFENPTCAPVNVFDEEPLTPGELVSLTKLVDQRPFDTLRKSGTSRDEAIYRALDNISLADINCLELFRDLEDPRMVIRPFRQILKGRPNVTSMLKILCGLHLWWKYCVKTGMFTLEDMKNIAKYVWEHKRELLSEISKHDLVGQGKYIEDLLTLGNGTTVLSTWTAKLAYKSTAFHVNGWLDVLNLLGLTPRFSDLWDIVPYSFVVDWVISIQDYLDRTELNGIQQRLPFIYGILGLKREARYEGIVHVRGHPFYVDLTWVDYERLVIDEFPPDVWFGKLFGDPRKQLVTGGALLIQHLLPD